MHHHLWHFAAAVLCGDHKMAAWTVSTATSRVLEVVGLGWHALAGLLILLHFRICQRAVQCRCCFAGYTSRQNLPAHTLW